MQLIRSADLRWTEVPGLPGAPAQMAEATTAADSDGLATGFIRMDGVRITRRLAYDEVVHVISGAMEVHLDGEVHRAGPGDCVFIPEGTTPTCIWDEPTFMFYAISPADWRDRVETPLATG
jgi:ethanolamine utilization protein EutQ